MPMTWPIDIIHDLEPDKFAEIFSVNPRSVREALFSRLGIKAQTRRIGLHVGSKNADRVRALFERLVGDAGKMERELASELLRNWLFTQRPMLADTLDHFGVKHDNGLTEQEIDFFEKLEKDKVVELCRLLVPKHGKHAVGIYLRYLKVPNAQEVLGSIPDASA
jgi:hypothetical protein